MLEKIKSSFKKSNSAKKVATQILYVSLADLNDISQNKKNAIFRLSRVLETHLRIERYNAMPNKNEINSLIFNHLVKAGLVCIREFRPNLSKSNNIETLALDLLSSGFLISFPCGSMKPDVAIEAIKNSVTNALKNQYPMLLTNKAFLTVMCIRQFHPHSLFAKLPKDVIKIILGHAKNTHDSPDNSRPQQISNFHTTLNWR